MTTQQDAQAVFQTVSDGGVAVFGVDVGYAIVGHSEDAIGRIFSIKRRSFGKPCGCFGNWEMFEQIIDADESARRFVSAVIHDNDLPLSIVGRYRPEHPILANAPAFTRKHATKGDTMDLLMNAGPRHDALADLALAAGRGVFGSSANMSLGGSKYAFDAVEAELRTGADLALDCGATRYSHPGGLGSTIIDLDTMRPFRIGIAFDHIRQIAADTCGIEIPDEVIA
ncbi:L-threonylcarbamoyladenylate synthase [Microbulbifer sp. S227A]|uniref:L-threonylcarbamoyladenylate synthase n=1 Tax=Microbulbifer sp. S227A TaxID=3415131 RepID=UPI003C7EB8ED